MGKYVFPLPTTCTSNESISRYWELPIIRKCAVDLPTKCEDTYNFSKCRTDLPYYQPVCVGYVPEDPCDVEPQPDECDCWIRTCFTVDWATLITNEWSFAIVYCDIPDFRLFIGALEGASGSLTEIVYAVTIQWVTLWNTVLMASYSRTEPVFWVYIDPTNLNNLCMYWDGTFVNEVLAGSGTTACSDACVTNEVPEEPVQNYVQITEQFNGCYNVPQTPPQEDWNNPDIMTPAVTGPGPAKLPPTPQPFVPPAPKNNCTENDYIDLQFTFVDRYNDWNGTPSFGWRETPDQAKWLIAIDLLDSCCNVIDENMQNWAELWWVGADCKGNFWQQIRINPEKIPLDCFSFRITLYHPIECERETYYLEPYKKETCRKTVKIEGFYRNKGCRINKVPHLYEEPPKYLGTFFYFSNAYRFYGTFESKGFTIERETSSNDQTLSTRVTEKFRLRSHMLPRYTAERIAHVMAAEEVFINDRSFLFSGDISTETERGTMYNLDLELTGTEVCETNNKCTNDEQI